MNIALGHNNAQFGATNNKVLAHKIQQQQAKLDKFTKHHQSSKDLRIPSGAFKSESGTPKNERNSSSNVTSPKSFSNAMNYSATPKGLKTGSNSSGGFSNRNKSWNMTPQPSSFRAPKDISSSSNKFINIGNHRTGNDNKSLSKFLDSRLDTKDRSTVEDSSYFDSLKLFTEEGDVSIIQSARRKSTELNASFRQQLLRSAGGSTAQPKTTVISKANSAKNLKPSMERHERPASSQFGKAVNSGGKSFERTEKLNKGKTNSEGGNSTPSKLLFTNWKDVEDDLTIPGTPSKMEDDERISLKDIIRLGSKTPQPDSAGQSGHSFAGGSDFMKQLIKEKEQDKKTIKALQEQILKMQELFDEMKDHRDSPNFAQNVAVKAEKTDVKDKEMSFLKIQNDTLKMTVDILKGENDILKNAQKQMAQFKEAAKRYRDLANSKSEECVRLADEVGNLRKEKGLSVAASPTSSHVTTPTKYDPTIKIESIFSPKSNRNLENIRKNIASSFSGQNPGENLVTENLETEVNEIRPPLPEIACEKPINYN